MHKPLFFVRKMGLNKLLMPRFLENKYQYHRNATERCAISSPRKRLTKETDRLYNHSTLLTMPYVRASLENEWVGHGFLYKITEPKYIN